MEVSQDTSTRPQETSPAPIAAALDPSRAASSRGGRENTYTLIYGGKGQGKTTLARQLYLDRIRSGGSGVWVDPTGTNGDLGTVCRTPAEWFGHVRAQLSAGRQFSTVIQLGWGQDHNSIWRILYEIGDVLLVLDEAEQFANAQRIDANLEELISLGRNKQVDIITTVRTPPELHGRLRGNRDRVITFRQPSRYYAGRINSEFFHLDDGEQLITSLPRFQYLEAIDGKVQRGRVATPWA